MEAAVNEEPPFSAKEQWESLKNMFPVDDTPEDDLEAQIREAQDQLVQLKKQRALIELRQRVAEETRQLELAREKLRATENSRALSTPRPASPRPASPPGDDPEPCIESPRKKQRTADSVPTEPAPHPDRSNLQPPNSNPATEEHSPIEPAIHPDSNPATAVQSSIEPANHPDRRILQPPNPNSSTPGHSPTEPAVHPDRRISQPPNPTSSTAEQSPTEPAVHPDRRISQPPNPTSSTAKQSPAEPAIHPERRILQPPYPNPAPAQKSPIENVAENASAWHPPAQITPMKPVRSNSPQKSPQSKQSDPPHNYPKAANPDKASLNPDRLEAPAAPRELFDSEATAHHNQIGNYQAVSAPEIPPKPRHNAGRAPPAPDVPIYYGRSIQEFRNWTTALKTHFREYPRWYQFEQNKVFRACKHAHYRLQKCWRGHIEDIPVNEQTYASFADFMAKQASSHTSRDISPADAKTRYYEAYQRSNQSITAFSNYLMLWHAHFPNNDTEHDQMRYLYGRMLKRLRNGGIKSHLDFEYYGDYVEYLQRVEDGTEPRTEDLLEHRISGPGFNPLKRGRN